MTTELHIQIEEMEVIVAPRWGAAEDWMWDHGYTVMYPNLAY